MINEDDWEMVKGALETLAKIPEPPKMKFDVIKQLTSKALGIWFGDVGCSVDADGVLVIEIQERRRRYLYQRAVELRRLWAAALHGKVRIELIEQE